VTALLKTKKLPLFGEGIFAFNQNATKDSNTQYYLATTLC
jgi:hypothetical protein